MYKLSNIEKYYLGTEILFFLEDSFRWSVCVVSIRYMSKKGRRLLGRGIVTAHVHPIRYSECCFGFGVVF